MLEKEKGLTEAEITLLRKKYGTNELRCGKKENFFFKIVHIVCEPMFLLLIIAATIYFILGKPKDGIIMLVFVFCIIMIDIIQEWKTDKTLSALKDLSDPKVIVYRDGKKKEIPSKDLLPGDIMYIYEGVKIPADGYIVKCSGLRIDESSLTGESEGVWKVLKDTGSNDYWRKDYCYQGTLVIQGTGIIKVDKIGNETEYGKIGYNLGKVTKDKTLLQKQTDKLVKVCAIVAFILFLTVGIFTFISLENLSIKDRIIQSILSGITLAMAMIPEEFPVVLTVFLSMGAWRLAKKQSLVKKLPAVETLGAVSVLCVDKTGTITKNRMEITDVVTNKNEKELAQIMGLCCEEETYDPMEKAMFKYAKRLGIYKKDLFDGRKIKEYPFSNDTKMMGCVWKKNNKLILASKGSSESILKICKLDKDELNRINNEIKIMQSKGLRVIALAKRDLKSIKDVLDNLEDNRLEYIGIVGLMDPPKDSVMEDIKLCKKANVRVVMITGDNGITASAIAKSIGMDNYDNIITGDMLDEMGDLELQEKVKTVSVFSRVIPEHKSRIVKAFQVSGGVVAMTGDGVNDAPAIKDAHVGIGMGITGTDVTKSASDIVLMDDSFSTIVVAVEEGRRIYNNIRNNIVFSLSSNFAEIFTIIIGLLTKTTILLPIYILFIDLVTDSIPSICLSFEKSEDSIMNKKPRGINKPLFTPFIKSCIASSAIIETIFVVLTYFISLKMYGQETAMSLALLSMVVQEIVYSISCRNLKESVVKQGLFSNKAMNYGLLLILLIELIVFVTPIGKLISITSIDISLILIVFLINFMAIFIYELIKPFLVKWFKD